MFVMIGKIREHADMEPIANTIIKDQRVVVHVLAVHVRAVHVRVLDVLVVCVLMVYVLLLKATSHRKYQ